MDKNIKKNSIGIMQGRLSPSLDGKIQSFPWKTWEDEFSAAASIGLDEIEFVFDCKDYLLNPIFSDQGVNKIKKLVGDTGVRVNYICADYFMERPFFKDSKPANLSNIKTLHHLIFQASKLNVKGIQVPLVDNSSIKTDQDKELLVRELKQCLDFAERFDIHIGLETDLRPKEYKELLDAFSHPLIRVHYDVGDSASLGHDIEEEFRTFGDYISKIHIKDRIFGGSTVPLGTGSADFDVFFKSIKKIDYKGSLILQVAREKDELSAARNNIAFVEKYLNK